ncbi:MAG: hypothetical protein WBB23_20685, partial [Desulforhopalus sp.]
HGHQKRMSTRKKTSTIMKLYFICPLHNKTFASDDYSLHQGHQVVENIEGMKELQGTVSLNSECPLCGEKHLYQVKDVLCPSSRGNNEE